MLRLIFVVVSVVVFTGCEKTNPGRCQLSENAGKGECPPPDAPAGFCMGANDCVSTPSTPVCATMNASPVCVQCTDDAKALCAGTTPLCKNNSCAACALDSECGTGGLCLPDGACAGFDTIIHAVSNGGKDVPGCGVPGGPGACKLERALTEATATKNVIKLDDNGPYTAGMNFVVNANVTIDARGSAPGGAVFHSVKNDTPILMINNNKIARIFGGTLTTTMNADGIVCGSNATLTVDGTLIDTIEKSGINATAGCKLTVTNATISHTSLKGGVSVASILAAGASITLSRSLLLSNIGGGINVTNGTFLIVGNVFSDNGDVVTSSFGGVLIATAQNSTNLIEFNTIESNHAMNGAKAPGADCVAGADPIARNNIIWDNNDNVGAQIGGTCQHAYSDIGVMGVVGTLNDGGHNLSGDPMIMTPKFDLHLQSSSPAIRNADPQAKLDGLAAKDIDGDLRVAPADIGQDQRPRP